MRMHNPVYVGFNGRAAALDRKTGDIVWSWRAPRGHGFVTLHFDRDALFASVQGHVYRLDPRTGRTLWHNPMRGFGYGVTCIATRRGGTDAAPLGAEDHVRRKKAAAAAGAAGASR